VSTPAARRERVLAALAAAAPGAVSGERLADELGCSRAAVHRHVDALRRDGLDVVAAREGYRLGEGADPVVPSAVAAALVPPLAGPVEWRHVTGSTNDDLVARARAGAPEGLVIGADHQTRGRGRRGRSWDALPGDALLLSVLLRPPVAPVEAGLLPIVVAVGVAEALGPRARLVWPNDVLVDDGKVAGILCEMSADQDRVAWAVAGIGVNVRAAPEVPGARWPPASLAGAGDRRGRGALVADLLGALGRVYSGWIAEGPAPVLEAFAARDHLAGRGVSVVLPEGEVAAVAAGLDDLGRLRLRTAGGERAVAAGEVVRVR
jgi:BirA family transcriptional regulator, biotin operon repressor / biotin---[acetyl-CoA-carboxylase] ligase